MGDSGEKDVNWWGSSYDDLLNFPDTVRREAGHQLDKVQHGLDPDDWKPFDDVGSGTREIRLKGEGSGSKRIFRDMYVVKFEEAVHVLHCFPKTTQATSKHDKQVASQRYKALLEWRKSLK